MGSRASKDINPQPQPAVLNEWVTAGPPLRHQTLNSAMLASSSSSYCLQQLKARVMGHWLASPISMWKGRQPVLADLLVSWKQEMSTVCQPDKRHRKNSLKGSPVLLSFVLLEQNPAVRPRAQGNLRTTV
ncbi:hypothetical protein CEXT_521531 [Caerostris extrusa]|uniref:Uncharacterized protein n=1 Tax=Caerostris extrusa TaxID=172846 RepID=A0AAV4SQ77_CAEEX|nr:hypothetical protein CEXT_521531 [Caerostris extrusa]